MTEEEWGSDFEQPVKRKSRLPILAWVFGSGCLLVLIVAIVAIVWGTRLYGKATDPDIQWPRVAEVLPFAERPTDLGIVGLPGQNWMFKLPDEDYHVLLTYSSVASDELREQFMGNAGGFKLEVQGRELSAVRMDPKGKGADSPAGGSLMSRFTPGHSIMVELSPPAASDLLILQFTAIASKQPVPEQLVIDFLEHFQVGQLR